MTSADTLPVLVGAGVASSREEDPERAPEALELMLRAVHSAGDDCGTPAALAGTGYIGVPHGQWDYRNPGGAIARAIGAEGARSVLASVGVLQQSLIGEACALIARGEIDTALVVGGDAGYRLLRARITGREVVDSQQDDDPDVHHQPATPLFHPVETALGLTMPIGLYAIIESAWRAQHELSPAAHRDRLGALYARLSAIAADNPHAWKREHLDATAIREAGRANPMQAFPYTRSMCSSLNVNQAAALLLCSAARARELGIARERWIYPVASTESNHLVPVSARAELARCPGAAIAGRAALAAGELGVDDIDLLDLYSCFPAAVEIYAEELGIPLERELSITGGMSFAGGPWNNYVYQATCRAAELLRDGHGRNAFITSVSGKLTKQGFGLWSLAPPPQGFHWTDVTGDVAAAQATVEVVRDYAGAATVAGYTVMHQRNAAPWVMALVDLPDARRTLVRATDGDAVARAESEDWIGRAVTVANNELRL